MSRMTKIFFLGAGFVFPLISSVSYAAENPDFRSKEKLMPAKSIEEVLKERARELMSLPGVVGVGQGLCDQNPCIKVFVIKRSAELDQEIPNSLGDYQVVIEETGRIKALPGNQD